MPKEDEAFKMSATQLYEISKSRDVIPCSLSADVGLGGGIPLGSMVLIGGKTGLGKTTTSLQYAANAQKIYGSEIFFYPPEGRLTHMVLSQTRGLNRDKMQIILPPSIEDKKGKILGHTKWPADRWWKEIIETIRNTRRSIVIVDSISSLSTEKEQSEGMGYQGRGDLQKLEAQFCRMIGDLIIPNQITVFLLAQTQANTSGYGPPIQIKAGNAIRFQSDIILVGKSVEKWNEEDGRIRGHDMKFYVEKSALGPPNLEITIPLRYGYGIDDIKDVINHCITWNIIKKNGSWFYLPFKDEKSTEIADLPDKEGIAVQGEPKIRTWFLTRPDHLKALEQSIRNKIFS
jgi:RecA/RadA recombinase